VSWKKSTIGDVLSVIKNGINCEQNKNPFGNKITRIETIAKKQFDFERVGYANLSEDEKLKSKLKLGDILFSHINSPSHVGKTAIYEGEEDIYHGINLLLMRTKEDIDPYFFNHYLNLLFTTGYWEENCKKSINQASVNQKDISKVQFNYPAIATQQKIVEKLDAIFAEIDKATAAAEANLKNAETLFKNYLTQQLNYKNGIRKPLDFFCSRITDGSHFSPKTTDDGYPYITVRDVGDFGIDFENCKYVSADDYEILKNNGCKPSYLDLLFSKDGTVGKVALVNREIDFVVLSSLAIITPKTNIINPEYLFYILKSPNFIAEAIGKKTGVAIRRIILKNLKSIFIEVPPLSDQMNAVQKIRSVEERCLVINNYYEKKINELILFKKSILNKAFSGELVKE